jgi:hypothetical protein
MPPLHSSAKAFTPTTTYASQQARVLDQRVLKGVASFAAEDPMPATPMAFQTLLGPAWAWHSQGPALTPFEVKPTLKHLIQALLEQNMSQIASMLHTVFTKTRHLLPHESNGLDSIFPERITGLFQPHEEAHLMKELPLLNHEQAVGLTALARQASGKGFTPVATDIASAPSFSSRHVHSQQAQQAQQAFHSMVPPSQPKDTLSMNPISDTDKAPVRVISPSDASPQLQHLVETNTFLSASINNLAQNYFASQETEDPEIASITQAMAFKTPPPSGRFIVS